MSLPRQGEQWHNGPMSLLASKFFCPVPRPSHVARDRLVVRLQRGLADRRPLTLVSAPAGYGKTTLVAAWLAAGERPHVWFTFDSADDEPGRFLLHLVAALRRLQSDLAEALFTALQAGQMPPIDLVVATLLNAIALWPDTRILVLDDLQILQHPAVLEILGALLQHQPPNLHLVLVTREDPPLPLTRARARDQLTEIRAADLRFTIDESARLLREHLNLNLETDAIARLTERTEGWAAGLQLAGLSLQGRDHPERLVDSLSGSQRFILGYLTEEVLAGLPADLHAFLLQTSILTQLSPELCAAVTGRADSAVLLERMLNANLFLIPLDEDGCWFRYHQLFADLLRHHLRRDRPDLVPELHRRASRWLADHDQPVAAIDHAFAAADDARAIALLEIHGWTLLNRGEVRAMEGWLRALPAEWRDGSPRLALDFAWMHLLRGQFATAHSYGERAQAAVERLGDAVQARPLQAECLALNANLFQAQGDLAASIAAARESLAAIKPGEDRLAGLAGLALGGAYRQSAPFDAARAALEQAAAASRRSGDWVTWMLAIAHLTLMAIQHGRLRFAYDVARTALEQVHVLGIAPPALTGAVHGALGLVAFEFDQLDEARRHFVDGIRLSTFADHTASLVYTRCNFSRLLLAEGDRAGAARELEEAVRGMRRGAPGWVRGEWIQRQVALHLAHDDIAGAEAVLRESGVTRDAPVTRATDGAHLGWLRLAVVRHDRDAGALADRIATAAEADQRHGTQLQALTLALRLRDDRQTLTQALALGEAEGYVHVFVDEGAALLERLLDAPPDLRQQPYVRRILAAFGPVQAAARTNLIEPLTERESEVLRLLAEGLSYAAIAGRLVVSVNTVRYHVKGLYGKLSVEKQSQAVQRARDLGLL